MTNEEKIDIVEEAQSSIERVISDLEELDDEEVNDNIIPKLKTMLDGGSLTTDLSLEEVRKRLYAN